MKKYVVISVLILLGSSAFLVIPKEKKVIPTSVKLLSTKNEVVVPVSKDYEDNLRAAGFTNLPGFVKKEANNMRAHYKNLYGLMFFSDKEMKSLLNDNGFLIGGANFYVGTIPTDAGTNMINNLNLVSKKETPFDRYDYAANEFVNQDEALRRWHAHMDAYEIDVLPLVFIAAPKEKFDMTSVRVQLNDNLVIEARKGDPIALYKVKGGWLQLAQW